MICVRENAGAEAFGRAPNTPTGSRLRTNPNRLSGIRKAISATESRRIPTRPGSLACRVGDPYGNAPAALLAEFATDTGMPRQPCLQSSRPIQERPGSLACRVGDPYGDAPATQAGMIVILIENTPAWGSPRTAAMTTIEI